MRAEAMKKLREGTVIPAVPLVLHDNRTFDDAGQRRLLRYYLSAGSGGLAVAVHTTQFAIRDPRFALYDTVLKTAAQVTDAYEKESGETIVRIAGVCGPTDQAIAEARTARELGYDAVLLSPGGLAGYDEEALLARTRAVAEIMPVVGFYLQPSVGGRLLSYGYWERLCAIENVVAIKAAPFNRYLTLDVARAAALSPRAGQIALYTGNDDNILTDLMTEYVFKKDGREYKARFVGGLLGHWAVWTHTAVEYYKKAREAAQRGAADAGLMTLAVQITDANSAFFDAANGFAGCIAGIHEVLRRQGLMDGIWTLDENETLSPGQAEEIDRVYAMYPHLHDDDFVKDFLGCASKSFTRL